MTSLLKYVCFLLETALTFLGAAIRLRVSHGLMALEDVALARNTESESVLSSKISALFFQKKKFLTLAQQEVRANWL